MKGICFLTTDLAAISIIAIQEQEKEDQRLDQLGLFNGQSRFERFTISSLRLCRRSLTQGLNRDLGLKLSF
jgi:hypothetical protein